VLNCVFPILFKLDKENGNCEVISLSWLLDSRKVGPSGRTDYDPLDGAQGQFAGLLRFFAKQQRDR